MVATPDPQRRRCSICRSPHKVQIHALIASGMSYRDIHPETVKMGRAFKRETIGKHVRICLGGVKPKLDAQGVHDMSREAKTQAEMDFAVMVQQRATELLAAGELRVTAQHGLTAQALLDRRAEKAADRDLALNMARLLSGAIAMTPLNVVEGRIVDVTPEALLLAPENVIEADA